MQATFDKIRKPILNIGNILDIKTGDFVKGEVNNILNGGMTLPLYGYGGYSRPMPNMNTIKVLRDKLEETAPNTVERWNIATAFLRYQGYTVKWKDETKCPEVIWFDFEGGGEEIGQYIQDVLHKDYRNDLNH